MLSKDQRCRTPAYTTYGRPSVFDELGRPVYSHDEDWNEEIHRAIRRFRLKAILRGSLPRSEK